MISSRLRLTAMSCRAQCGSDLAAAKAMLER